MSKNVLNELPGLVNAGIIDAATSDRIENYYRQKRAAAPDGRINIVFAILGAVLVSLGIILVVAHNWDGLSRPVKLFFSFLPLVVGQAACAYALYKKEGNAGWKEGSSAFLFIAVGACLSLVSQLYHISGTIEGLLFTWMLIVFPLVYIMRSSMASLLYICGITVYACYDGYGYQANESYHYWWMLLLVMPHYWWLMKHRPQSNFTYFHHWFIPLSLTICLGTVAGKSGELMMIAYMSMFGAFYLLGTSGSFYAKRIFNNGYIVLGSLGTVVMLLVTSFRYVWQDMENDNHLIFLDTPQMIAIAITFAMASILLSRHLQKRGETPVNYMGFIYLVFTGIFFIALRNALLATILVNLLVLGVAVFIIARGNYLNHLGILNYGLMVITALVVCRFFDTNISFVIRGLMFIAVGAGFFIANNRLLKKRKANYEK